MKVFKCLNCGFVFKTPKIIYVEKPTNPGVIQAIAREALYMPKQVCPKCESDAIKEEEIE